MPIIIVMKYSIKIVIIWSQQVGMALLSLWLMKNKHFLINKIDKKQESQFVVDSCKPEFIFK